MDPLPLWASVTGVELARPSLKNPLMSPVLYLLPLTNSRSGEVPTSEMGVKSLSKSYGSLAVTAGAMAWGNSTRAMVYPSGAALAAASVPMRPDAPDRLSTITLCPSDSPMRCAMARAMASVLPPGAHGTISRTGLSG